MPEEPIGVFVVTLEGVEAAGAPPLTVLAFVRAGEEAEAMAAAAAEVEALGWSQVRALRAGEIVDAAALPEDFRGALQTALTWGCGLIVYEEG